VSKWRGEKLNGSREKIEALEMFEVVVVDVSPEMTIKPFPEKRGGP